MLFTLFPHDKIIDIKLNFEKIFPGLRLEFFNKHHNPGEASSRSEQINGSVTILEIQPKFERTTFIIEPEHTVAQVEAKFYDKAGLNVQLFRKMGNTWIETIQTDQYTLARQMDMSAESMGY